MKNHLLLFLAGLATAGISVAQTPPSFELSQSFWTSPRFIAEFMGTYGFDGEREPKINQEEATLIQQIIPLIQANQYAQAVTVLKAGVTATSSAALDFTLANLYLQNSDYKQAEDNYRAAIRKFPNFMNAYKNLGTVLIQTNKFQEAIPNLIKTIELGGATGVLYGVLGYCYLNTERYASAENSYRNALLLDPGSTDWKNGMIQSMNAQGKNEELVGILNEVIAENPGNADYWIFQANAFINQEKYIDAITNLEILDRLGRSTGRSLMLLGDLYMREGVAEPALIAYQKSLAKGAEMQNEAFVRAASILVMQGNYKEGEAYIGKINESRGGKLSDKEKLELLNLQSEIYLSTGEEDKAAGVLEEVLKVDPLNGAALLNLADYKARKNLIEEAEILLERAEKLEKFEVPALIEHARLLVDQRKFRQAADLLRRAQVLQPRDNVQRYLEAVERAAATQGS